MLAVIMQPTYLPWIGYFDLLDRADIFILLDNVQLEKQSWQQRNRIKTSGGWRWLSAHIVQKFPQNLDETLINSSQNWIGKHSKTIEQSYCRAEYWEEYGPSFLDMYSHPYEYLLDLNIAIICWLAEQLEIGTKMVRASSIPVSGGRVDRLINICNYIGADFYLSPPGSAAYIEEDNRFSTEDIKLEYQQYEHPIYKQLYGEFISHMAAIDLLFNEGANSLGIIRSGRREEK